MSEFAAFAAQDALKTLLDGLKASSLDGWTVDCGLPQRRDDLHVWVHDDVDDWTFTDLVTGQVMGDEHFLLYVYVYSRRLDSTFTEQRDEVGGAADAIKAAIKADHTLAGAVSHAHVAGAKYEGAFEDEEGRVRFGILRLEVDCRIWA